MISTVLTRNKKKVEITESVQPLTTEIKPEKKEKELGLEIKEDKPIINEVKEEVPEIKEEPKVEESHEIKEEPVKVKAPKTTKK